jgi:hypothetical protein
MKKIFYSIWGIFALFLVLRLLPYLNNNVPLGYDGGIYLYLFNIFPKLPVWQLSGFSPGLFVVVFPFAKLFSSESLLIPVSILSQIALFFSVYFVSKKIFNKKIALLNTFLFTVSLIQFRTFWFFYVKNTFALAIFLPALYFLSKKKLLPSIAFAVLLSYFHLPTFLIYFVAIIVLTLLDYKNFRFYLKVFISVMAIFSIYYLPTFNQTILPLLIPVLQSAAPYKLITTGNLADAGGTFYSLPISFLMTIFYLPFAFFGAWLLKREQNTKPFLITLIALFLMVITNFFFSLRYFIPLDLFLIFFAGYAINYVFEKYKNHKDIIPILFIVLIFFITAFILKTGQPLITPQVLGEIKDFGNAKNGYILSTSKEDSAWLLGYTNLKLIAWDFGGEDKYWNKNQWNDFFGSVTVAKKLSLLDKLPKPLYIFINDKQLPYSKDVAATACVNKLTDHFYQYDCRK